MSAIFVHQDKALFFSPSWEADEHDVVIPPDRELPPEIAERVADDQLLLFAKRLTAARIELAMLVLERAATQPPTVSLDGSDCHRHQAQ